MAQKQRLSEVESKFVVEGLAALARENTRLAQDARRLGYPAQADQFVAVARDAAALHSLAQSVDIERITVRYSY